MPAERRARSETLALALGVVLFLAAILWPLVRS